MTNPKIAIDTDVQGRIAQAQDDFAGPQVALSLATEVTPREQATLSDILSDALTCLEPAERQETGILDALAVCLLERGILQSAPALAGAIAAMRADKLDLVYAQGLPRAPQLAPLMALILGRATGELFNYTCQNDGDLLMRLVPTDDGPVHSQSTRADHAWHSDDAIMPEDCRVQRLSLYGVVNPPGTLTSYTSIATAERMMSSIALGVLFQKRFSIRPPTIFRWGEDVWSRPRAILSKDAQGRTHIAWPSYNTRVLDLDDRAALVALAELEAAVEAAGAAFALDPGCWLSLNNLRGVHRRGAVPVGERCVLRTCARDDLTALRIATGTCGSVFDGHAVLRGSGEV